MYARGKERVELEDVAAVVTDASELALDTLTDAVFAGKIPEVEFQFTKARNAGTSVGAMLFAAARHVSLLHKARLAVDDGQSPDSAGSMWLHFSRVPLAQAALKAWSSARLQSAMGQIADATLQSRLNAGLAETITQRLLLSLAMSARRKE
jgi:DNA polymerase-3 subunit delta